MLENSRNSAYFERLSDSLVSTVNEDRIGTPRFVRWFDRIDPETSVDESLSLAVGVCNRIFDGEPSRLERSGSGESHGSIHAVWAIGASALISIGPSGELSAATRTTDPEIMLLGSSGAIYFDGPLGGQRTVEQVAR